MECEQDRLGISIEFFLFQDDLREQLGHSFSAGVTEVYVVHEEIGVSGDTVRSVEQFDGTSFSEGFNP
jgi:hypothetical protein